MPWLLVLLVACTLDGSSIGGGGTEGTPTGGGTTAGSNGGDDGGLGDDTAATTDCTADDLVWSTQPQGSNGKPFYAGDSITFWGEVDNPCAKPLSLVLVSTCLFDVVTLHPPNGDSSQQAIVPGCTTTTARTIEIAPYDLQLQSVTWGTLYVAGQYGYSMQATTLDARAVNGSFTIQ